MSCDNRNFSIRDWDDPSYQRFVQAGGEVGIAIGENGEDTISHHAAVLAHAIRSYCIGDVDQERLQITTPFEIDIQTFHGSWFDCDKGLLVHKGLVTTKAGFSITDPYFVDIKDCSSRSSHIPELWQSGGFAFAFCDPPYSLETEWLETQRLYTAITSRLISEKDVKIYNWHRESLLEAVPGLDAGTEWWGVFAFTIFVPQSRRIFGMVASATD